MEAFASEYLWIVIVGFCIAFLLAFGVGANDVANSFGTSVGSGVLTFKQACILATFCETTGSVLLGYHVSDTIRKGIIDVNDFKGMEKELMLGMLAALAGSALWMFVATFMKLPVSTTHSIVGSTIGFVLVALGPKGINLKVLGVIVASWFISPVLSGLLSVLVITMIKKFIFKATKPVRAAFLALPIIYAVTIFVNVISVLMTGSSILGFDKLNLWVILLIGTLLALVAAATCQIFVVPYMKRKVESPTSPDKLSKSKHGLSTETVMTSVDAVDAAAETSTNGSAAWMEKQVKQSQENANDGNGQDKEDDVKVNKLFHSLQTLTAMFTSFAHGGNDVSNAIGPLIAIWLIFNDGSVAQKSESPILLLLYGGVGMSIGMWCFGRRVNTTIGKSLTKIVPMSGFSIEFSSAITVLLSSKLGIPISSTHCIVGSIVFAGWAHGERDELENGVEKQRAKVDWSLFRSIIYAWLVTIPAAGGASALMMAIFQLAFL